jgi:hypothetical protein
MSRYVCHGQRVAARATVVQQKTSRPVQFDITESTRSALAGCIRLSGLASVDFLFPSRVHASPHFLSTRQYARIADSWSRKSGLIRPLTEPIPFAALSRLSPIHEPGTCALCSSSWAIRSSRAALPWYRGSHPWPRPRTFSRENPLHAHAEVDAALGQKNRQELVAHMGLSAPCPSPRCHQAKAHEILGKAARSVTARPG